MAAAIVKIKTTYDKEGRPRVEVKLHPKVCPLDLLAQHFCLWKNAEEQAQTAQTNAFLEFLNFVKSPAFDEIADKGLRPSLSNPLPGVVIELENGERIGRAETGTKRTIDAPDLVSPPSDRERGGSAAEVEDVLNVEERQGLVEGLDDDSGCQV